MANVIVFHSVLGIRRGRSGQRIGAYITGMGQDANHEIYLLTTGNTGPSGNTGQIYRIIPSQN